MKLRNIAYLTFVTTIFHCSATFGGVVSQTNAFAETLKERDPQIRELLRDSKATANALRLTSQVEGVDAVDRAIKLNRSLWLTSHVEKVESFLAKPDAIQDASAVRQFLSSVISLSVGGTRQFVRNDAVVECLVQALTHPEREVRETALDTLEHGTRASEYRAYVTQLIAAWRVSEGNYEILSLIGATHTAEGDAFLREIPRMDPDKSMSSVRNAAPGGDQTTAVLKALMKEAEAREATAKDVHAPTNHELPKMLMPEEIRAYLGEPGVEEDLIRRFLVETNAQAKCDLALKLGYVGSTNAVLALVKELRSPLMVKMNYGRYSVRAKIIEALGLAFPESRLFNEELQEVRHNSSGNEQVQKERQVPYIQKVERWCQDRFGINWQRDRPDEVLFWSEPIGHPR